MKAKKLKVLVRYTLERIGGGKEGSGGPDPPFSFNLCSKDYYIILELINSESIFHAFD